MISLERYFESEQRYYYWVCNKPTTIKSFKKQRSQQAWRKNFNQQRKESTNKQQLQKINGGTFASLKEQIANQKENSRVCKSC